MSNADLIVLADRIRTLDPAANRPGGGRAGRGDRRTRRAPRRPRLDRPGHPGGRPRSGRADPGLVDGHIHPVFGIDLTTGVDLSGARTMAQLRAVIAAAAAQLGPQDWFCGYGLDPNAFEDAPVTAAPLTAVLGDRPALVTMFDAHSALATPAALARAGITGPREFDGGASIVCDARGVPTGHLLEIPAYQPVRDVLPVQSTARRRAGSPRSWPDGRDRDHRRQRDGLRRRLRGPGRRGRAGRRAADPAAVRPVLHARRQARRARPHRAAAGPRRAALAGRGGQVLHRRHHRRGHRLAGAAGHARRVAAPFWPDPGEYTEAIGYLAGRGVPIVTHSIGDRGTRYVLDALAGLPPAGSAPDRAPGDAARGAGRPVPGPGRGGQHAAAALHALHHGRAHRQLVGPARPQRAARAFCVRDLHEAGAVVALGSDWPIGPYDARWVLGRRAAAPALGPARGDPRRARPGPHPRPWRWPATPRTRPGPTGWPTVSGTISVGKRADLTAFTVDPLAAPPDELAVTPIALTVVAGTIAHRDPRTN